MFHFAENPGTAYAASTDHNGIHSILFETLFTDFGGSDIAITDDRDLHAGILFYLADQCPVCLSGIHLCSGTSVDGKGGDTAILQLFSQVYDDPVVGIPA